MSTDFTQVIAEYGPLLGRVASSYEANDALRQELTQEIALAVWQGLQRFQGKSSIKTYILKIAHNRAVSHVATQTRHPRNDDYQEEHTAGAGNYWSPEKQVEQQTQLTQMLAVIRDMPVQSKQVLTLFMEGLSYEEIADVSGLNTNHVGVVLKRGKDKIVKALNDDGL